MNPKERRKQMSKKNEIKQNKSTVQTSESKENKLKSFSQKRTLSELLTEITNKRYVLIILSVILSMILWAVVSQKTDSQITLHFQDIPIDFDKSLMGTNAELAGYKIYNPEFDEAAINITANRKDAIKIKASDYYVSVDMATSPNIYLEAQPVFVNLKVYNKDTNDEVTNASIINRKVQVYFFKNTIKELTPFPNANLVSTQNYKSNIVTAKNIRITGPENILDKIYSCTFQVNPENKISFNEENDEISFSRKYKINQDGNNLYFYDSNMKDISVEVNEYIDKGYISHQEEIELTYTWSKKLDLDLTYEITNLPYKNFDVDFIKDRITLSQPTISVWSKNPSQNGMTTLPVAADENISLNDIGFDFHGGTFSITKALENYDDLVCDVKSAKKCDYTFNTTGLHSKKFENVTNLISRNPYPDKFDFEIVTEYLKEVTIIGSQEDISSIKPDDLQLIVDISSNDVSDNSDFIDSIRTYPVTVTVSEKYPHVWAVGKYQADVLIKNKTADDNYVHQ